MVLVRGHGEGLETFWVRRSDAVPVQPGFHAFLGGKVDPQDLELPIEGAPDDFERAARSCAIREAFEEAGVLVGLAPPPADAPGDPRLADLEAARARLLEGSATFPELARERGWRFDARSLEPAGRWTTPPFATARFDTCYYLARVAGGQRPSVLPGELATGEWVRPLAALDRYRHGEVIFVAPILWTLIALAEGEEGLLERLILGPERALRRGAARQQRATIAEHSEHPAPGQSASVILVVSAIHRYLPTAIIQGWSCASSLPGADVQSPTLVQRRARSPQPASRGSGG